MIRAELIKRIHVLKNDLTLDNDTYRSILFNATGEVTCTKIDLEGLNLVYLSLQCLVGRDSRPDHNQNERQHTMIPRLMEILGWNWTRTAEFCKQITGKNNTRKCTAAELAKMIRGMVAVIDMYLEKGRVTMTPQQRSEYERHVRKNVLDTTLRSHTAKLVSSIPHETSMTIPSPLEGEGRGGVNSNDLPF